MFRTRTRTHRLVLIASIVTSACIVTAGSYAVVSTLGPSVERATAAVAAAPSVPGRSTTTSGSDSTGNTTSESARTTTSTSTSTSTDHVDTRLTEAGVGVREPEREQFLRGPLGTGDRTGAITFAYAGDSITARPDSWLHVLEPDTRFHAVGGYAHSGYRADQVLHEIAPVPTADVLVVELGTNDVNQAVPTATTIANVDALVSKVDAAHVLVVAGPPSDSTTSHWGADRRTGQLVLSRALRTDAESHGWSYVDPFTAFRASDGAWIRGSSPDGIHGTAASNVVIARAMAAAIARTSGE